MNKSFQCFLLVIIPLEIVITAITVRMKKTTAMGLFRKTRKFPPDIAKERRSPLSSMGANTKAIRNGTVDISKMAIK